MRGKVESMKLEDLKVGMRVRYVTYIPGLSENGTVSSWNEAWVFVKFDSSVAKHGFDGACAEGCNLSALVFIEPRR